MDAPEPSSSAAEFTFYGTDAKECQQFIRSVRKKGFQVGKQDDDRWLAHYAATCFDGEALWWYEDLDRDTKNDWALLSRALREEYVSKVQNETAERFDPFRSRKPPF